MDQNIPVSLTRNDAAMVLVFDGPTCIYIAGFSSRQAAEINRELVLDFVIGDYGDEDLTTKVVG